MHHDPMTGAEFKIRRNAISHTQESLAERWGLHRDTIINIEKMDTVPQHYVDALRNVEREAVNNGKN